MKHSLVSYRQFVFPCPLKTSRCEWCRWQLCERYRYL